MFGVKRNESSQSLVSSQMTIGFTSIGGKVGGQSGRLLHSLVQQRRDQDWGWGWGGRTKNEADRYMDEALDNVINGDDYDVLKW